MAGQGSRAENSCLQRHGRWDDERGHEHDEQILVGCEEPRREHAAATDRPFEALDRDAQIATLEPLAYSPRRLTRLMPRHVDFEPPCASDPLAPATASSSSASLRV